jgi:hypothetical protein
MNSCELRAQGLTELLPFQSVLTASKSTPLVGI